MEVLPYRGELMEMAVMAVESYLLVVVERLVMVIHWETRPVVEKQVFRMEQLEVIVEEVLRLLVATASAVALRVLMEEAVVVDTPEVLEETALAEVAVVVVSSVLWLYREVVP